MNIEKSKINKSKVIWFHEIIEIYTSVRTKYLL